MDIPDDPRLIAGAMLRDKWRIDGVLGRGGMATVFAATHRNGSRGALKVLHAELARDPAIRTRFLREGYLANKIDHPGVVRVVDDDVTDDGLVFLVMELLEGETAKARWLANARRLPPDDVLAIADAVLDILTSAHAAGVVHRDVKPDNIFLTKDAVKLLDFGIARVREGAPEITQTGAMLGTPAFMSPEQALAHWDKVDARSDLFSLSATLWVLISGRAVHEATTVPELLIAMATKQAAPFASVVPDAPIELQRLIDRGLAFDRADRWPGAPAMRVAVGEARNALAGVALSVSTIQSAPEPSTGPSAEPRPAAEPASAPLAEASSLVREPTEATPSIRRAGRTASATTIASLVLGASGVALGVWAVTRPAVVQPPDRPSLTSAAPAQVASVSPSTEPEASAAPPPLEPSTRASASATAPSRPAPAAGKACAKHTDCGHNQSCTNGLCRCSFPDRVLCNGVCVHLPTNQKNCGRCGKSCAADEACSDSKCVPCRGASVAVCDNRCVMTTVDLFHCGGCGRACTGHGARCEFGKCVTGPPASRTATPPGG